MRGTGYVAANGLSIRELLVSCRGSIPAADEGLADLWLARFSSKDPSRERLVNEQPTGSKSIVQSRSGKGS
jgi:hypothetical protein